MQTMLGSNGVVTLPSAARARLGLKAGDRLVVTVVDDDTIVLKRVKRAPSTPLKTLRGLLARPKRALSVEEMDAGIAEHLRGKHRSGTRK